MVQGLGSSSYIEGFGELLQQGLLGLGRFMHSILERMTRCLMNIPSSSRSYDPYSDSRVRVRGDSRGMC